MSRVLTSALPRECYLDERARHLSGEIEYVAAQEESMKTQFRMRTFLNQNRTKEDISFNAIFESQARITIGIGCTGSFFKIGLNTSGRWDIAFFDDASHIELGRAITSNGVNIMASGSTLIVGDDCMFSDNIRIHCGDNHAIIDLETDNLLNGGPGEIVIGEHVWIGSGARIMKGARLGKGSIVAAGAVVPGRSFPECCLIAGNPARVKRQGVSWTRSTTGTEWKHIKRKYFDLPFNKDDSVDNR